MPTVEVPAGYEPQFLTIYAVRESVDTIELPDTPKVRRVLESWLAANHYRRTDQGGWLLDDFPDTLSFVDALGHCSTLPD